MNAADVARQVYEAYVRKDRSAIEVLIHEDFHFTSPRDNRLDRATYFSRCWPGSQQMDAIDVIHAVAQGEHAFMTYDAHMQDGKAFRNTEVLTVQDGKLIEAQVFFGWTLPHEAPEGGFI
jgi:ketosteroid isomerase-like protein